MTPGALTANTIALPELVGENVNFPPAADDFRLRLIESGVPAIACQGYVRTQEFDHATRSADVVPPKLNAKGLPEASVDFMMTVPGESTLSKAHCTLSLSVG